MTAPRPGPSPTQQLVLGVVALAPLSLGIFLWLVAPAFVDPIWDERVALFGVPLGLTLLVLVVAITALAVLVAVRVRSKLVAAVLVTLLAGVGLYLVLLAPALVLIVIELGST